MKVTTKMMVDGFLTGIQNNMEEILKKNEQLATSKKVNRPSDDPAAISRILNYKNELKFTATYRRAIDSAKSPLESIDSALSNLSNSLIRASELSLTGASDTMDSQSRLMIAKEVDTLLEGAVSIANTKVGDKYIFSGFGSNVAPIDTNTGEFVSDTSTFEIEISVGVKIALNLSAGDIFSFKRLKTTDSSNSILPPYNYNFDATVPPATPPDADPISALYASKPASGAFTDPAADIFSTQGGVLVIKSNAADISPVTVTLAAGGGTGAGGAYTLNDIRDALNSQAGSKVKASVVNIGDSTNKDYRLIISSSPVGNSEKLRITVTPNGGDAGPYAGDAGLASLAYDPAATQNMTLGGDIVNYNYITDTSNPNYYSFNNNYLNENSVLRALHFLKVSLQSNDSGRIQKAVGYVGKVIEKVSQSSAEIGSRLNKVDTEGTYQEDREFNISGYLSNEQDVDIAKVFSELTQRQTSLQALQTISIDLIKRSLFDFIR